MMYPRIRIFLSLIVMLTFFLSCLEKEKEKNKISIALEEEFVSPDVNVRQIFYNINLPTEMAGIFERSGVNYNPAILNSPDNFSRYLSPNKIALNLGLYGVDLSYAKLYDQASSTARYFLTLQLLSQKLGIPDTFYLDIIKTFEQYRDDKDSLTWLAGKIYERSDQYLKENDKESYAALIMLGGWIEAVYIACKIIESDPDNMEMIDRVGEQKYSLNSLISLLNNYQDDINLVENILMLKQLKKSFDRIEIYYNQGSFKVDTLNQLISASEYVVDISPEIIMEISSVISKMRIQIVN